MEEGEIKAKLQELHIEASVALVIRVGFRVLPLLATDGLEVKRCESIKAYEKYMSELRLKDFPSVWLNHIIAASSTPAEEYKATLDALELSKMSEERRRFEYWPKDDSARILLDVLLAYDFGLMVVWKMDSSRLGEGLRGRLDGVILPKTSDRIYGLVTTISNAVIHAILLASRPDADAATSVATIASRIASAFVKIFDVGGVLIKSDLEILKKNGPCELIESPLWHDNLPDWRLGNFFRAVRDLNCGFDIWLNWYWARCCGDFVDVTELKQRVFLPDSVANQSPQEINAYLASLISGQAAGPLNRVRTIFIGDGEAGKTSLIRVLNDEPVVEGVEAKTPGIAIRPWKVPGTDITASFWDFGGQVMVHATHQLFLRESCLYVLLVSAREKEKATERAEYWLEHVKSFGRGSPVLIVANKADKEPVQLDQGLLTTKYPGMIAGFYQLACTEAQGRFKSQFEQFKAAFCQQLQAVGLHQVKFEKAHFAVLQNLQKRTPKEAFLSKDDYATLCHEHKVDQQAVLDANWLLRILDQLGVIVHFPDMADEMDEYILNPRWLTYGVYTIMYHEQPRVTRKQAVALLCAKPVADQEGNVLTYPASKCRIVFDAMEKFKLCYFLPQDREQIIIPALLPSDIKPHRFDSASALEFHYQFESFLPRHLISELIVECHEDIAKQEGEDIVWQQGVLLHNRVHNTDALVQADYHFRRLTIWLTRSAQVADFLAVLRDKVERIVKRIDIRYTRNIRLPREALLETGSMPAGPEWADFGQILIMRNKNRPIYDHPSGSEYSISKILGLFESQARAEAGGNTTIHIHQSTLGDLTVAGKVVDSFNRGAG